MGGGARVDWGREEGDVPPWWMCCDGWIGFGVVIAVLLL